MKNLLYIVGIIAIAAVAYSVIKTNNTDVVVPTTVAPVVMEENVATDVTEEVAEVEPTTGEEVMVDEAVAEEAPAAEEVAA